MRLIFMEHIKPYTDKTSAFTITECYLGFMILIYLCHIARCSQTVEKLWLMEVLGINQAQKKLKNPFQICSLIRYIFKCLYLCLNI